MGLWGDIMVLNMEVSRMKRRLFSPFPVFCLLLIPFSVSHAWLDETHVAIAKAAGYSKWFNAAGPNMIREKIGKREGDNHFVYNFRGQDVTPEMVLAEAAKYNQIDRYGHLYGAIIASVRDYLKKRETGRHAEYHLAFCAHYVGDLSQPVHNTEHNEFESVHHKDIDGVVDEGILANLDKIKIYPITISSEGDLAKEIARIANLTKTLGYKLEDDFRIITKEEAYEQLSHSASLFKAIMDYVKGAKPEK
jgi:hypothetical protein